MTLSVLQDLPLLEPVAPPDFNSSSFRYVEVKEHVSLLPCYVGRLSQGIIEYLNQKIFRFSNQLGGIILSYSKPVVMQQHGAILDEQPHVHFDLKYTAYLFKPQIGSLLSGVVNNVGRDHIGCLVHNCFNASVLGPSSAEHENSWLTEPFHIDSKVWFKVTNLDNVGGIVSIRGEYFDTGIVHEESETSVEISACEDHSDSRLNNKITYSAKKARHKNKKSKTLNDSELSMSKTDTSKKTSSSKLDTSTSNQSMNKEVEQSSSTKKKRKRQRDDTNETPKSKRAKQIGVEDEPEIPQKKRKHKH